MPQFSRVCLVCAVAFGMPAIAAAQEQQAAAGRPIHAAVHQAASPRLARIFGPDRKLFTAEEGKPAAPRRARTAQPDSGRSDPLSDGVTRGALIGAGIGGVLTLAASTQCNGSCDDPSLGVFLIGMTTVGAGLGALIGWAVDLAR